MHEGLEPGIWMRAGYCPHTVTAYNRATIKGLIYPYYEDNSGVAEWGQYPRLRVDGWGGVRGEGVR